MTLAMPNTETDMDLEVLEFLDFENTENCEWQQECANEPEWFVQCAECGSPETICTPHIMELKAAIEKFDFTFTFDRTCGHQVKASSCPIVPMT